MANQEMLIAGLRNQRELLDELITQLSDKTPLSDSDNVLYDSTTKNIEQNLRTLRKIVENRL